MSQRRNGLVIEGDDLIGRNRGDGVLARQGLITNDTRLDLSLLVHLMSRPGARAFIVGFIEPDVDAVIAAIWRHTRRRRLMAFSNERLANYVRASARCSKLLRPMAHEAGIPTLS